VLAPAEAGKKGVADAIRIPSGFAGTGEKELQDAGPGRGIPRPAKGQGEDDMAEKINTTRKRGPQR